MKPVSPFCELIRIDEEKYECIFCKKIFNKELIENQPLPTCRVSFASLKIGEFRNITPIDRSKYISHTFIPSIKIQKPIIKREKDKVIPEGGPGTELKKLLGYIGIKAKPNCKCNARAKQMDIWGSDICEQKIDTILEWLKEESSNRGLPFIESAAKILVKRAIKNARKKQTKPSP